MLEYCDKGCLRNALDDGVFILGTFKRFNAGVPSPFEPMHQQ